MIALGVLGFAATLAEKIWFMYLVFVVAFVPIGLYLLGTPSWFAIIGAAMLAFLASTIGLQTTRRLSGVTGTAVSGQGK